MAQDPPPTVAHPKGDETTRSLIFSEPSQQPLLSSLLTMGACLSANIDPDPHPAGLPQTRGDQAVTGLPTGGNHPLISKSHLAWKSDTPLTPTTLKRMREEFWDTAPSYSGRAEIWQALRAACEAATLELAQAIVDSANMTVPTGKLSDGCYDELGNNYRIPLYCILEPSNMSSDPTTASSTSSSNPPQLPASTPASAHAMSPLSSSHKSSHSMISPSVNQYLQTPITITARLSVGKDIKLVSISRDTTVAELRNMLASHPEASDRTRDANLKVFYLGRLIPDTGTVRELHLLDGGVVQVMIVPKM
ncbi:hypothetical protein DFJ77DRAFT_295457 [Powellomyces hirtus]|nr:hypothetical protein DFJ77DRAFT_295457 [Powellomyces hirtus]